MPNTANLLSMAEARHPGWIAPPKAIKGPIPKLTTLWTIERILHDAWVRDDGPLSMEELKRRLGARRIRPSTLQTCVDELGRQGKISATPTGIMWTLAPPGYEQYVRSRKWAPL